MNKIAILFLSIVLLTAAVKAQQNEKSRPNILFAIADDATYLHMSIYGCKWVNTPAFDRVATNGVLFNKAYTPNAKCAPSRACILTGRNSWELEEAANHMPFFPSKFVSFPEVLANNGYQVGYTGKGWAPGAAKNADGTPRDLLIKPYNALQLDAPTKGVHSDDYAANFNTFLNQQAQGKPFFFWYGGWEPHRPYEFGSSLKNGKKLSDLYDVYAMWPKNDSVKTDLLDYAYELEYFDKQLQKMIDNLEERKLLDNTVIIVTADNGMPFPRIKGQEYEYSNHLPLAIMWPKGIQKTKRQIDDFVNFTDLAPTILEIAGIKKENNNMQPIRGKSLVNLLQSDKSGQIEAGRDHVLIGKERHDIGRPNNEGYPIRGIFKGDYLYLHNFKIARWPAGNPETGYLNCDGSPTKTAALNTFGTNQHTVWQLNFGKRPQEELYNVKTDPLCLNNLAMNTEFKKTAEKLYKQMVSELSAQKDPRILGNGDIFDQYKIAPLKYMNYYENYLSGKFTDELFWVNKSDYRPEQAKENK
ncbi:sulfatase family protein [Pedobacter sp. MW01-1-1]|uniref:sulfatase family protein n=1 Tax=Pedobacter sp. MW01-1-1 TaxID=3383027 RepID=UPI003FF0A67D